MDFFEIFISIIKTIQFRDVIDILAIAFIIFGLFRLVRETRAVQLLKGVLFLFIIYFLSSLFQLVMLSSLLRAFFEASVVLIAIIFQPEIRKALEQVGRNKKWKRLITIFRQGRGDEWEQKVKKSIIDAADTATLFSHSRTGALIVFERETMLSDIAATGTVVDASIIRDGKLFAAGCILPLTDNTDVDINLGTRHRAALGISEQSDAVVLVISEETGVISLAFDGELTRDYTRESLIKKLNELMLDEFEDVNTFRLKRGRKSK